MSLSSHTILIGKMRQTGPHYKRTLLHEPSDSEIVLFCHICSCNKRLIKPFKPNVLIDDPFTIIGLFNGGCI